MQSSAASKNVLIAARNLVLSRREGIGSGKFDRANAPAKIEPTRSAPEKRNLARHRPAYIVDISKEAKAASKFDQVRQQQEGKQRDTVDLAKMKVRGQRETSPKPKHRLKLEASEKPGADGVPGYPLELKAEKVDQKDAQKPSGDDDVIRVVPGADGQLSRAEPKTQTRAKRNEFVKSNFDKLAESPSSNHQSKEVADALNRLAEAL